MINLSSKIIKFVLVLLYNSEISSLVKCGDILMLRECFSKLWNHGQIRLRMKNELLLRKIDDFCMEFNDTPIQIQNEMTPNEIFISKITSSSSRECRVKDLEVNKDKRKEEKISNEVKRVNPYKPPAFRIPKFARPTALPGIIKTSTTQTTSIKREHEIATEQYSKPRISHAAESKLPTAESYRNKMKTQLEARKNILKEIFR